MRSDACIRRCLCCGSWMHLSKGCYTCLQVSQSDNVRGWPVQSLSFLFQELQSRKAQ